MIDQVVRSGKAGTVWDWVLTVSCRSGFDEPLSMSDFRACLVDGSGSLAFLLVALITPWCPVKGLQKPNTILVLGYRGSVCAHSCNFRLAHYQRGAGTRKNLIPIEPKGSWRNRKEFQNRWKSLSLLLWNFEKQELTCFSMTFNVMFFCLILS